MKTLLIATGIAVAALGIVAGADIARARAANAEVQRLAAAVCQAAQEGQSVSPALSLGEELGGVSSMDGDTWVVSFTLPSSETMQCVIGHSSGIVQWANAVELGD